MSDILSQEEVDALLKGVSDGEIETEEEDDRDPSAIRSYDVTGQDRIIRGRMPTLEMITEKFARSFRATLLSLLRKAVTINALSVDMIKYGEFMKSIPVPSSLHAFKMDPLRGNSLLVIESKVIFALVDIIFGGSGRTVYKIEGRDFTAIENNLIKKVVLSVLSDFEKVWEITMKLNVVYQRSETNPQFMQIVSPTDVVIVVKFEIDLEFSSGTMTFCIPYSTIEPIREKLQGGYQTDTFDVDKEWMSRFMDGLRYSNVNLTVELGKTELSGREVVGLKKGDVIPLNRYCSDGLDIYVEDVFKFKGYAGIYKGSQAIEISEIIGAKKQTG
ncbi:MAG: flagellar motor switch protein FliM [Thermodesulfobacteriota bacterium]|nr:flagellar motor switch protein FliM [Thermodesulfobacteriota bacterium]